MKPYGPKWAVLIARLVGHRDPLADRLMRNPTLELAERDFLKDRLANPDKWPTPKQVLASREKLERAAYYLEFLYDEVDARFPEMFEREYSRFNVAALQKVADKFGVDKKTIRRAVKFAKALGGGEWWTSASHLAKKGPRKRASLRRTF